jgi:deazaflavin-dependent oxidoreductase (nitroreductase family)
MSDDHDWNRKIIEEFRANGGIVGGHFTGKTLLLLHTRGAKSGQARITPVACVPANGDGLAIIASNNGSPRNPAWYHNLLANPQVTVEFGRETFQVHASLAEEPERTHIFDRMAAMMPIFDRYRRETLRQIPVLLLKRTGS